MKKLILYIPFILFLIIVIFLLIFLLQNKDPAKPPSALLNQDLPNFKVKSLFDETKMMSDYDIKEKQVLINFFASWCIPCKAEHSLLNYLKIQNPNLIIIGINHKDKKVDAIKFLEDSGNPYNFVGIDDNGSVGLEFGVFGLPETFITNNKGKVIYKNIGPITKDIIKKEINSILKKQDE